jgi:hypothetical protein
MFEVGANSCHFERWGFHVIYIVEALGTGLSHGWLPVGPRQP